MSWFWIGFSAVQLAVIWYLARRLVRTEDRHATAVRQAEEALHQANIALRAVGHLQKLNAQLRRHRSPLVLNGELFVPYATGQDSTGKTWRIYPKQ